MKTAPSHDELVKLGVWALQNTFDCRNSVVVEGVALPPWFRGTERPDAFGITSTYQSVVIEAKASYQDWHVDAKKPWRSGPDGLGQLRYYLTSPSIPIPKNLPKGWGVLHGSIGPTRVVTEVRQSNVFVLSTRALLAERSILARELQTRNMLEVASAVVSERKEWEERAIQHIRCLGPGTYFASDIVRAVGKPDNMSLSKATDSLAKLARRGMLGTDISSPTVQPRPTIVLDK